MRTLLLILVFACLCISACQKASYEDLSKSSNNSFPVSLSKLASANVSSLSSSQACRLPLQQDVKPDSILVPTRLGASLTGNPYAVANMQQASLNLYGTDQGIVANRKYIRYRPTSLNQMEILAESDLDLFDYPLDQEVEEEGDYYPQPGLGENDLPWLYTVVDVSYQPITGIPYEELARVYIPDSDVYLEDEAFRLTGNVISPDDCSGTTPAGSLNGDVSSALVDFQCAPGYYWDADQHRCIPDHPITPPPPPPTSQPAGMIRVWDNSVGERGVRRTRVVLRRFLKIDRVYTDDNGNFISSKRFRNKVNVIVKFKSTQLTTRGLRGVRFWQMLFPIKQAIGKYSENLNNFPPYLFTSDRLGGDARNRNWWAALLMNAYLEYNEHAAALGVSAAPNNLRILLTNWHDAAGGGSTPMNYLRTNEDLPSQAYLQQFVVSPLTAWGSSGL